jgi:hypothetical protein
MSERMMIPVVVIMMALAMLFAFDNYSTAGISGYATASGIDCSDSDGNNDLVSGVTSSSIYANGYEQDRCVGDDLLEFYCGQNGPDVRIVNCYFGCSAGACD